MAAPVSVVLGSGGAPAAFEAAQAQSLLAAQAAKSGSKGKDVDFGEVFERMTNPLKNFTHALGDLGGTFDKLTGLVQETVGAFRPIALLQFNRAMMDLQGTIGSVLLPIMNQMTDTVRSLADYFYNLPPSFKDVARAAIDGIIVLGGLALAVGTVTTVLLSMPFARVGQALQWLWNTFTDTAGGMSAVTKALDLVEGSFQGLIDVFDMAWAATSGARAGLSQAFDQLGTALSNLFDAIKPALAFNITLIGLVLTGVISIAATALKIFTGVITRFTEAVTASIAPLNKLLGIRGFNLPDVSGREKGSSFGMGFGAGGVRSPEALYNELTNQIIQNSRAAGPAETTASNTTRMADALDLFAGPLARVIGLGAINQQQAANVAGGFAAGGPAGAAGALAANADQGKIGQILQGLLMVIP